MMKGLNWKAIFKGLGFYLVAEATLYLASHRIVGYYGHNHLVRSWYFSYFRDGICSLMTGYISAGSEPKKWLKNEIAVFALIFLLSCVAIFQWLSRFGSVSPSALSNWFFILVLTLLWLYLGGYFRSRRQPNRTPEVLQPPIPHP